MTVKVEIHNGTPAVTEQRKHARPQHWAAVMLADVMVTPQAVRGEPLERWDWQYELDENVLKHFRALVQTPRGFMFADDLQAYLIREAERAKARKAKKKIPESLPEPGTVTGHTFKAAFICGPTIYVSKR